MAPITSALVEVGAVRDFADILTVAAKSWVRALFPNSTDAMLEDLSVCIKEAFNNAADHAYKTMPSGVGVVKMLLQYVPERKSVEVTLRDTGKGIYNIEQALKAGFTTGSAKHSGMGFSIIKQFSDDFEVISKLNRGTVVKIVKVVQE